MLRHLFCCCSKTESSEDAQDERSQLLPQSEDDPGVSSYDAAAVYHQKAKERLSVIVKAKEGKMVRVLSRVPFNLRNEPSNGFNSSSSRSNRSPSTNVSTNHITEQPSGTDPMHRTAQRLPPSPSISRSASASSVQQASMSRLSTDDLSDPYGEHKFRAQLVPTSKSSSHAYSRRGRSRTRHGRISSESNDAGRMPTLEGIQSVDSGRGNFHEHDAPLLGKSSEVVSTREEQNSAGGAEIVPLSKRDNDEIRALSNDLATTLQEDFGDVGMLTRSWGD